MRLPRSLGRTWTFLSLGACALTQGCASPPGPAAPLGPPLDPRQEALALERATQLEGPVRVVFAWSVDEPGLRARGRGVARMEPPNRARLDLFAANGETVLRAAMVGDELRLPPGYQASLVPPPALFWSAMGIFRPGAGTYLLGGEREAGDRVRLEYRVSDGQELRYRLWNRTLERVELLRGGQTFEQLTLTPSREVRFPREAVYRHLGEFRELKFTLETVDHVEPFPPDIWHPGR